MKIKLTLSYVGTAYHGWQRQDNAKTVQGELEEAVFRVTGQRVHISGCGRTDAGVHAKNYVASMELETRVPLTKLPLALNAYLGPDISVSAAEETYADFDARFSCVRKEYTYRMLTARVRDPFMSAFSYHAVMPLDFEKMRETAEFIVGTHDFSAFRTLGSNVKTTVRTVYYCDVTRAEDIISVKVSADGFLYNMVRAIAGTLYYAGLGKLAPEDIPRIFAEKNRANAGPVLPPEGLCLTGVWY